MSISSRTPEGYPLDCPICGGMAVLEISSPGGDACCPICGHLLWWIRDRIGKGLGVSPEEIPLSQSFSDLPFDSLDVVELVMELEEEFEVELTGDEAERIQTIADAIRLIRRRQRRDSE